MRQETWEDPSGHKKEGDSLLGNYCLQHGRAEVLRKYRAVGMLQWRGATASIWKGVLYV